MITAIIAAGASLLLGVLAEAWIAGFGCMVSVAVIGAFIITLIEQKK